MLGCALVLMFQILGGSHGAKLCCNINAPNFQTDT